MLVLDCHAASGVMVSSRPKLRLRVMSGSVTLMQPGSVLVSLDPVTMESSEDRAVQSWSHPSPTAALGRVGPASHLGVGVGSCTSELFLKV